jgi:hypothetical protein
MPAAFQFFAQLVERKLQAGDAVQVHAVEMITGQLFQGFLDQFFPPGRRIFSFGAVLFLDACQADFHDIVPVFMPEVMLERGQKLHIPPLFGHALFARKVFRDGIIQFRRIGIGVFILVARVARKERLLERQLGRLGLLEGDGLALVPINSRDMLARVFGISL